MLYSQTYLQIHIATLSKTKKPLKQLSGFLIL